MSINTHGDISVGQVFKGVEISGDRTHTSYFIVLGGNNTQVGGGRWRWIVARSFWISGYTGMATMEKTTKELLDMECVGHLPHPDHFAKFPCFDSTCVGGEQFLFTSNEDNEVPEYENVWSREVTKEIVRKMVVHGLLNNDGIFTAKKIIRNALEDH